jgi:hypothetical protein
MRCLRNRDHRMERPMDIRARASSKSRVAETPRESYRWIYRRPRFLRQQSNWPLLRSDPPRGNTGIPLAPVEKMPQARACEDGLAGIAWPIRDVANVARCVWAKQAGHSRRTKFLKCSRSSLLSNVKQRNSDCKRTWNYAGITRKQAYRKAAWRAGTISVPG